MPDQKTSILLSVFIIVAVTFIAFSPCLKNGFVNWDDPAYIINNDSIKQLSAKNLRTIFTSSYVANYQPLSILTYAIEYHFFKLNPTAYHAMNILLHISNCLLVFWVIMLITGRISLSLITALLFGVHPLRVESVAWLAERKDVLYAFFFLLSLVSYLYYARKKLIKCYLLSLFLFLFSILSKAQAVTLPLVFFAFDYLLMRKLDKKLLMEKIPFFVLSVIFGIIAIITQRDAMQYIGFDTLLYRMQIAVLGLVTYFNKILFPVRLSAVYPYPSQDFSFYVMTIFSIVLVCILSFVVFLSGRFTKKIIFGSYFLFITILPVLQFIPVGAFFMADRYSYIPSIGISYLFSEGVLWLYNRRYKHENIVRYIQRAALFIFICLLTFLTYKRTIVWNNDFALWNNALENYPTAATADCCLSKAYGEIGEFDKAVFHLDKALEKRMYAPAAFLIANIADAYYNLGVSYENKGYLDQAISSYTKSIEINPKDASAYYNRGNAYFYKGSIEDSIADYTRAIQIKPNHIGAYNNRANAYMSKQEYGKAWEDVHKIESLGGEASSKLLEELKRLVP